MEDDGCDGDGDGGGGEERVEDGGADDGVAGGVAVV